MESDKAPSVFGFSRFRTGKEGLVPLARLVVLHTTGRVPTRRASTRRACFPENALAFRAVDRVASAVRPQRRRTCTPILTAPGSAITRSGLRVSAYLKSGGTLEKAAAMANHASTRTTQLYDRRRDKLSLGEVERILI